MVILLAPVSVNHAALYDTTLRGYNIPTSNCDVIANIYASHLDPSVFPEPETFCPSRFINEKGEYQRYEAVIPFGLGKQFYTYRGGQYVKREIEKGLF